MAALRVLMNLEGLLQPNIKVFISLKYRRKPTVLSNVTKKQGNLLRPH